MIFFLLEGGATSYPFLRSGSWVNPLLSPVLGIRGRRDWGLSGYPPKELMDVVLAHSCGPEDPDAGGSGFFFVDLNGVSRGIVGFRIRHIHFS